MQRLRQSAVRATWATGVEKSVPLIGEWHRYWSTKSGDAGEKSPPASPRSDPKGRGRGKAVEPPAADKSSAAGWVAKPFIPRSDASAGNAGIRKVGAPFSLPKKLPSASGPGAATSKDDNAAPQPITDLKSRLTSGDTSPKRRAFVLPTSLDRLAVDTPDKPSALAASQPSKPPSAKTSLKVPENLKLNNSRLALPELPYEEEQVEEVAFDDIDARTGVDAGLDVDDFAADLASPIPGIRTERRQRPPTRPQVSPRKESASPRKDTPSPSPLSSSPARSDSKAAEAKSSKGGRAGRKGGAAPVPVDELVEGGVAEEEVADADTAGRLSTSSAFETDHAAKSARARRKAAAFSLPSALDVDPGAFYVDRLDHQIRLQADPNLESASLLSPMPDPSKWEQRAVDRPSAFIVAQLHEKIAVHKGELVADDGRRFHIDLLGVEAYMDAQVEAARAIEMPLLDANARAAPGGEDEQALNAIADTVPRDSAARPTVDKYLTTITVGGRASLCTHHASCT
eukprot:jgi/Mesvir1/19704/Mv09967-RA.1